MSRERLLLELLSKTTKEHRAAKAAWEARGPKGKWLVLLDELKRTELEFNEILDTIAKEY
jgi:hypothetical protein